MQQLKIRFNMAKNVNKFFSRQDTQMANKHVKIHLTLLVIREMQIETSIRYHFISIKLTRINKNQIISLIESMEKSESLYTVERKEKLSIFVNDIIT